MNSNVATILRTRKSAIILGGLFVMALVFVFMIMTEPRYRAETDILIAQADSTATDFYTLSRSNEYLNNVLSDALYSELFINEVESVISLDELLPNERSKRLDVWKETVAVGKNFQGNMLHITVYHDSAQKSLEISESIAKVLSEKNYLFRSGSKDGVFVKVVSGPFVENNPPLEKLIMTSFFGFVIGGVLTFFFFLFRENSQQQKVQSKFSNTMINTNR